MTSKEAVNWLINLTADIGKSEHRDLWHYEQALYEIKEMLEGKDINVPSNDTISRQDVIELVKNSYYNLAGRLKDTWEMVADVERLPSAQPEIIRCTECKHYREYDSKYVENAVVVQCMADRYPISETIPDGWFCAGAERKDDE